MRGHRMVTARNVICSHAKCFGVLKRFRKISSDWCGACIILRPLQRNADRPNGPVEPAFLPAFFDCDLRVATRYLLFSTAESFLYPRLH